MTVLSAPLIMSESNLADLRRIPFFSGLPDDILRTVAANLHRERFAKDDVVFVQGGLGNAMYLIESGQVAVIAQSGTEDKILSYLGPGSYFGEMALLLGERRSATVKVTIDAELLVLHKTDLDNLLVQFPSISLMFSRELSRRLSFTDHRPVIVKSYKIAAIVGGKIEALADSLAQQTGGTVFALKLDGGQAPVGPVTNPAVKIVDAPVTMSAPGLSEALSAQVDHFDWILMHLMPRATEVTMKAMELADITVQVGAPNAQWKQVLAAHKHWVVADTPDEIGPLARRIARKSVGLALSSGSARGIAHIGVLKVLQEAKVPIDMIAGTSAGALFGGFYAAGMTIDELTGFALDLQHMAGLKAGLWDFAFPPRSGLIRGNRTVNYLKRFIGNRRFEELKIPMHIVAADVVSGEEVVFSEGLMVDAIRASMSVIGVFAPARVESRFLIDGGAINPVPTSVLSGRGADVIIASVVIPSLEDRLSRKAMKREGKEPNLLGVLMSMMEVMESEMIRTRMSPANVVIRPSVEIYNSTEFERARDFIRLGEEAAYRSLDQIKQLFQTQPQARLN
ncbi:MAG: cyclic nucleotide-binding domain-containing protein [Chloroflexi bacterium]|nr:cyclic nucleotide-binding domain-containing protein [Chloroflexota bacterium]